MIPLSAVVPLNALSRAKSRLAPELDAERRRELVVWMLDHVLATCAATPAIAEILVVAGDEQGASAARRPGVDVIVQAAGGLSAALDLADHRLEGRAATLVVAADLPLLTPADLGRICAAATASPCVVLAPTHDGGTGGLLRRPGAVIPTAYGPSSAAAHRRLAAAAGVACHEVASEGFALDLDTSWQLEALRAVAPGRGPWDG